MGTKKVVRKPNPPAPDTTSIADALFTKGQQRVLGVLFGNAGRSFYANEIIALADTGTGAVQRELGRLEIAGLVTVTRVGKQKHYQANPESPVFEELRALVVKTSGLVDVLRTALAPRSKDVRLAFIYGSVAKRRDSATSDIDLMVISDALVYADLFKALAHAEGLLGRKVNPTIYSSAELARRIRDKNAFIVRVLAQPKIWLTGGDRDLPA